MNTNLIKYVIIALIMMNLINCTKESETKKNEITPYVYTGYLLCNPGEDYRIVLVNLENIQKNIGGI